MRSRPTVHETTPCEPEQAPDSWRVILDEQMPAWDVRERHSVAVAASPERTLAAAREVFAEL